VLHRRSNYPRVPRFAAVLASFAAAVGPGTLSPAGDTSTEPPPSAPQADAPEASRQAGPSTISVGIDVWRQRGFAPLAGKRIGLISNLTGRDRNGILTVEVLRREPTLTLAALFSPEHGFLGVEEGSVESTDDEASGLIIYSLYGETRRPTPEMLAGLEGLVFDIQDIGTRFYTYATTMAYAMEEAAAHGLPIVVLDRPNPIDGTHVQGPLLDPGELSFVGYAPIPLRHGMTMGELARYFNEELDIGADLTVIEVDGWHRGDWYDATGLAWVNPSPNMRNLVQATLYPAVGPLETTNLSVGRGTDEPFEWFGAPWIDARRLAAHLNDAGLPGIRFVPRSRTPDASVYAHELCHGVDLILTDRNSFAAGRTAITLAHTLHALYPDDWEMERFPRLWGRPEVVAQLRSGLSPDQIAATWKDQLQAFLEVRRRYLLYDLER